MAPSHPRQRAVAFLCAFTLAFAALNYGASRAAAALRAARDRDLMLMRHLPGATPHYDWSCGEDLASALPAVPDGRKAPLVLVSGMSQTYAINDAREGALPLPDRLDASLARRGVRAFGLVAPNLQNEEALLMLVAALSRPETAPRAWLYGLCFDKLRNVDVRPTMLAFLATRTDVRERWDHICDSESAAFPLACERLRSTSKRAAEEQPAATTTIRTLEENTRSAAGVLMPLARDRTALNAAGQTKIYELRNWLLGIRTTTERPIIPARYQLNMEILRLSARVAKRNGVRPIFYIIPLNPEARAPYRPEEYAAFKEQAAALARDEEVAFANLENAVPEGEWGLLYGQPDFKHFREAGHARLAETLERSFESEWQRLVRPKGDAEP